MPFLLMTLLLLACLPFNWPAPPFGIGVTGSLLLTGLATGAQLLAAGVIGRLAQRRLEPGQLDSAADRYSTARHYFFFATLGGFFLCLLGLGWGSTAVELGTISFNDRMILIPGGELLILVPFLIVQIGSWAIFFDADRTFHRLAVGPARPNRYWTRTGYILFMFRQQLIMVFTPLMPMLIASGVSRVYPELMDEEWLPFAVLGAIVPILVFFPLVLRPLLGLKPLPPGPIRDRLVANAQRLRFRHSGIYLWETRGQMANALVMGLVPQIRYVVFTDRLLDDLSDEEIDGVFGHEVGHIHYGHIAYYTCFFVLSFLLIGAVVQTTGLMEQSLSIVLAAPIVLMAAYIFSIFGLVSRRCERQADIFGCRAGSCRNGHCHGHDESTVLPEAGQGLCPTGVANFIKALERVDEIMGLTRPDPIWRGAGLLGKLHWIFRLLTGWLRHWQHSTIPKRIAYLRSISRNPEIEQRFQRRTWALKWLVMIGLIASLIGLGAATSWSVLIPRMNDAAYGDAPRTAIMPNH